MSLYYSDPDQNMVELQVDNFGDWDASAEWLRTAEDFRRDPIGSFFDPDLVLAAALWYRGGIPPVPIRWLLVRDPSGELDPQAFLATDLNAHPHDILAWFVSRWQVEVTVDDLPYCTPLYVIGKDRVS